MSQFYVPIAVYKANRRGCGRGMTIKSKTVTEALTDHKIAFAPLCHFSRRAEVRTTATRHVFHRLYGNSTCRSREREDGENFEEVCQGGWLRYEQEDTWGPQPLIRSSRYHQAGFPEIPPQSTWYRIASD
jgi:hypothetical protein